MNDAAPPVEVLTEENHRLLSELEVAYKNMELILEQSAREKEIAYQELQEKFDALESLYRELSKKENLLIHLEKLSSIGQFIAEIIHELQSPLTAISAHAELALMLEPVDDVRREIGEISEQVMRMSGYLHRFKAMAYKSSESFDLFDLGETLADGVTTIDIIKPAEIKVEVRFPETVLTVNGDPYQVGQIFLNLAKNAFDAMHVHGSCLRIQARQVSSSWIRQSDEVGAVHCSGDAAWAQILDRHDSFALIEFIDDGPGIHPDCLDDVFQAFYTTKDRGKGTGLGLSISSDIAKRHEGDIALKSVLGEGTTFQLLLPLVADDSGADYDRER